MVMRCQVSVAQETCSSSWGMTSSTAAITASRTSPLGSSAPSAARFFQSPLHLVSASMTASSMAISQVSWSADPAARTTPCIRWLSMAWTSRAAGLT
jgi:hypothetical protein